jgi:hypothetical protein
VPDLSSAERLRLYRAVTSARANVELSGVRLSPEIEVLVARYIAGDLSDREHIEALLDHACTLPAGKQVQEYFTSLDEAITRHPAGDRSGRAYIRPDKECGWSAR